MTETVTIITEQIPGPPGPSTATKVAVSAATAGLVFVTVSGGVRVADTAGLVINPVPSGVFLTSAAAGADVTIQTSGIVAASVTGLPSGAACPVGINASGALVRFDDPAIVPGFYIGDTDTAGDVTIGYRVASGNSLPSAASPPTSGTYTIGDVIFNSTPTRIGPPGLGYYIHAWQCTATGTPGAWTPIYAQLSPTLPTEEFAGIQKTGAAGYGQRDGCQLLYLNGFYYLLGGWDAALPNAWSATEVTTNEVWRSPDLVTWTKILAHDSNPPLGGAGARWRRRHSFGTLVIGNYMYVIGGDTSDTGPPYPSDIWRSLDGITWELMAATSPWLYLSIVGYFQGAIHIIGGSGDPVQHKRSTDGGLTWETLTPTPFPRASVTRAVVDSNRNRMYVIGGLNPDTSALMNDCWEYDGTTWVQVSASAAWLGREWIATAHYESRLWALTGSNVSNRGGARYSEDGGATWTELDAVPWPGSHADGVFATSAGIAMAGGSSFADKAYLLKKLAPDPSVFTATLPWTLWCSGSGFDPNTPRVLSKNSSGTSGTRTLNIVSGSPTQGEINGRPTIILDGVNDVLRYTGAGEALDLISRTSYVICFTGKIISSPTDDVTTYQNPGIACESSAYFGIGVRSSGVVEAYHDGGSATHADVAWTTGQLVRIQVWFDGTTLRIRKNKGAWASVAKGIITPVSLGPFAIGSRHNLTAFAALELGEILVSNSPAITEDDLNRVDDEQLLKWGT